MYESSSNTDLYFLIGITAFLFLALFIIVGVTFYHQFSKELKYLKNEIRRTEGVERRYWIKRKRRLWLSLLPFVKY